MLAKIFAIWLTLTSFEAVAEDAESIREVCRRQVAGAYLTTYNQWIRTRDYAQLLTRQLANLRSQEPKAQKDYQARKKDVAQHEYDVARQRAESAAKNRWQNISEQIQKLADLAEKTKTEHDMAEKALTKLRAELEQVFKIISLDEAQNKFPYRIEYKSPCPKYRYTCPLPNKDAYNLRDISVAGDQCRAYVTFSLGMNRR